MDDDRQRIAEGFSTVFSNRAQVIVKAPGRVNLIGEHTDYNGGWMLPIPLSLYTHIALAPRPDQTVRVFSDQMPNAGYETYTLCELERRRTWIDYLQGVHSVLQRRGFTCRGADVYIASDVPLGAGLSSSAALEVAFLRALRQAFDMPLTDVDIALVGQQCENDFVGAQVGIMDQMVISVGQMGHALLLHAADLSFSHIKLPETLDLGIVDSGLRHAHVDGAYNKRRAECAEAAALLNIDNLSQIEPDAQSTPATLQGLPPPLRQRARHVVSENGRVQRAAAALQQGELEALGELLYESHRSLAEDYEVSLPVIDALVRQAAKHPDILGARLTGGGFGGSIIVLTRANAPNGAATAALDIVSKCHSIAPRARVVL